MSLASLRDELQQARASAAIGDTETVLQKLDQALRQLEPTQLLPVDEIAHLLDIRSSAVVQYWARSGFLTGVSDEGTLLIPVSEVERVQDSERVRALRASDALHDASAELGDDAGMSDEDLRVLEASRPGTPPWKR